MSTIPFPFAITTDKRQPGINQLGDLRPTLQVMDFRQVMTREFLDDVHFVCYGVISPGETIVDSDPWPRINKPSLTSIREAGGDVVLSAMVLDFDLQDNPDLIGSNYMTDGGDKPIWTPELLEDFWGILADLKEELLERGIAPPNVIYTTTHGARFVHKLAHLLPVGENAENLIRGLIATYRDIGLMVDRACADWTRLFRAPKVVRGGNKTWITQWFSMRTDNQYLLDSAAITPVTRAMHNDSYAELKVIDRGQPTPEDCYARLYTTNSNHEQRDTDKLKAARKTLKGTDCYSIIFDDQPIAEEGSRDATLIKLVGQSVAHLMPCELTFEPEDIYAMFLGAVEQLRPDAGTPDWTASLWTKVKTCWSREDAKLRAQDQLRDEERVLAASKERKLLEIVRATCDIPEIHADDESVSLMALNAMKLVIDPARRVRCLTMKGYSKLSSAPQDIKILIRQCGATDIIEMTHLNKKGEEVESKPEQIMARHAVMVTSVEGQVGIEANCVQGTSRENLILVESLYCRAKHSAKYSAPVEAWLREMVGPENLNELNRWLAYCLAFDEGPIAALSLAGASGAGKGMLVRGLIECIEGEDFATSKDLVADKNVGMKLSPFMVIDEGLPRRLPGGRDIADTFRSLTAGEPTQVDEKYKTMMKVCNPMRLVFTANNTDVIKQLAGRSLSQDDMHALTLRILHFNVRHQATEHLIARGGMQYTAGWVAAVSGGGSDYTLARHIIHLYERRHNFDRDSRLLVEGNPDALVVQEMRTVDPIAERIALLLLKMSESGPSHATIVQRGISMENGEFYATSASILALHQADLGIRADLNLTCIGRAMKNLCHGKTKGRREAVDGNTYNFTWHEVDLGHLASFADEHGLPCDSIRGLLREVAGNRL